ncbi:MAG: hypothetical protein U0350_39890 [Caldilineaceae bacterium]
MGAIHGTEGHSPLPWRLDDEGVIVDANGLILMSIRKSQAECIANRNLILHCVNAGGYGGEGAGAEADAVEGVGRERGEAGA